ncbi:MAG: hypothetical protein ACRCYY_14950 [Trueperaceae bacterium]
MIRPFIESDYAQISKLKTIVDPNWPVTTEMLEHWDKTRSPEHYFARFVLEKDGYTVACAETGHDSWANDPPNKAMLGMNIALGFERQPSYLRFQKALDGRTLEPFDEINYQ